MLGGTARNRRDLAIDQLTHVVVEQAAGDGEEPGGGAGRVVHDLARRTKDESVSRRPSNTKRGLLEMPHTPFGHVTKASGARVDLQTPRSAT